MAEEEVITQDPFDPPAIFVVEKRRKISLEGPDTTVSFAVEEVGGDNIALRGAYFFDGSFFMDRDIFNDTDIPAARERFSVIYEATANSDDLTEAEIFIKVWTNSTSFKVLSSGSVLDIRQPASTFDTIHNFIGASFLDRFDPILDSGIPYYPSITATASLTPLYTTPDTISDVVFESGDTTPITMIDGGEYGVLNIVFTFSLSWFFDEDRTLAVGSPPASLPDIDDIDAENSSTRVTFSNASKFSVTGGVLDDGTMLFSSIIKNSFAIDEGKSPGDMLYLFQDTDGVMSSDIEIDITVNDNGIPIQSGNDSGVYLLGAP